jgi:hypothetical protein
MTQSIKNSKPNYHLTMMRLTGTINKMLNWSISNTMVILDFTYSISSIMHNVSHKNSPKSLLRIVAEEDITMEMMKNVLKIITMMVQDLRKMLK